MKMMKSFILAGFLSGPLFGQAIEIKQPNLADFRSYIADIYQDQNFSMVPSAITLPLSISNEAGEDIRLTNVLAILDYGNKKEILNWQHIVDIQPGYNCWTCIVDGVGVTTIAAGDTYEKEIMFSKFAAMPWGATIDDFLNAKNVKLSLQANIEKGSEGSLSSAMLEATCTIDHTQWQNTVSDFIAAQGRLPGRITMECTELQD